VDESLQNYVRTVQEGSKHDTIREVSEIPWFSRI